MKPWADSDCSGPRRVGGGLRRRSGQKYLRCHRCSVTWGSRGALKLKFLLCQLIVNFFLRFHHVCYVHTHRLSYWNSHSATPQPFPGCTNRRSSGPARKCRKPSSRHGGQGSPSEENGQEPVRFSLKHTEARILIMLYSAILHLSLLRTTC